MLLQRMQHASLLPPTHTYTHSRTHGYTLLALLTCQQARANAAEMSLARDNPPIFSDVQVGARHTES